MPSDTLPSATVVNATVAQTTAAQATAAQGFVFVVAVRLMVLAGIVYGIWRICRPCYDFRVVVKSSGVVSHTGIRTPQQRRLLRLVSESVVTDEKVVICGRTDTEGQLRLTFSGAIDAGTQQQIRNFVLAER